MKLFIYLCPFKNLIDGKAFEYSDQTDQVFRSKLTNPSIGEKKSKFPVKKMGGSR